MNKRGFLKTSGAFLAGGIFSNLVADESKTEGRTNWSGNYQYKAERLDVPASVADVQKTIQSCRQLKALGARHSFNSIADTSGDQVSLKNLNTMVLDRKSNTVSVGAGVTYGHLAPYLDSNGFAVHNLASLPHVSVVGACATATHGSGSRNGNLSTIVSGMEMLTADGKLLVLSREHDGNRFRGAVVGLGGLGIITNITLDVQPAFQVKQVVYENLSFAQLEKHLDEIFLSGYSVSLFTDWQNHRATQVWIKSRVDSGASATIASEFFGAKAATRKLHPLAGHSAENCTEQMGIPGPWYERLPHFRMNFTPSSGQELQSEYFVPRNKAYEAILAVEQLREQIAPHLFVSEFRTIDADDLWMSPCYKRASMAIHFTWKPEWPAVKEILPMIEAQLAPFDARPHWAKLFTMSPPLLQSLYTKLPDFDQLLTQHDPDGKFRNRFLNINLGDPEWANRKESRMSTLSAPMMSVELIDGREIEKPLPKKLHIVLRSYLIVALSRLLSDRFMTLPECNVLTGGLTPDGRREYIVPDVVAIPVSAMFNDGDLAEAPLLGVEILSPGQTITELFGRADRLVKLGSPNVWVIWPEKRKAWAVGRDQFDEAHSKLRLALPPGSDPEYVNILVDAMWAEMDRK